MTTEQNATVRSEGPPPPTPENVLDLVKRDLTLSFLLDLKEKEPDKPLFGRSWSFRRVAVGHTERIRLLYDRRQGSWFPTSGAYSGDHPTCRVEADGDTFYGVYEMSMNSIFYTFENEDCIVLTCRSVL